MTKLTKEELQDEVLEALRACDDALDGRNALAVMLSAAQIAAEAAENIGIDVEDLLQVVSMRYAIAVGEREDCTPLGATIQ